ncbi:NAD(P)H-dependent oxidoreductase [Vibrio algarum]|uniref:NAD(P)H-dependent oxidoreductase n=1 Tax=Vibrio algarum TaxID=3020714 RepID=A0ABT4YNF1_9VIBR|nr:NAD(P)H-dependent oxidoreductase [Vibrio sp. KJ40-1]MDB1122942.1 NAD(P)H-dependent oxidoreductase [Vibrio sp. KJ40-1]
MKVLGISGSPRREAISGTYKLVKTVAENTGHEYEIISLRGKKFQAAKLAFDAPKTIYAQ